MEKRVALVIGINDYSSAPLKWCEDDALSIRDTLSMPEYNFDTTLILGKNATRKEILKQLDICRRKNPKIFLFYFSGHGCSTNRGAFLVSFDGEALDEGIELKTLSSIMSTFPPSESSTILVLDCCHSGEASPWTPSTRPIGRHSLENEIDVIAQSRIILAACRPEQYSFEDDTYKHGAFTYHLLNGLLGDAADYEGNITLHSLYDYICKPFEKDIKQKPVFRADISGRVVIATSLPPMHSKPAGDELSKLLIDEATNLIDEYLSKTNVLRDKWKASGYRYATKTLEPILRWFTNKVEEYPDLKRRNDFMEIYQTAMQELGRLTSVIPGTIIEKGIIEKHIGSGTFGNVWKINIEDNDKHESLAYKIFHATDLHCEDKIKRFNRGYRAMKQLDHPFIVKVHGETECPIGFFMDYIDGPNLRQIQSGITDTGNKISILWLIADTLRHSHDRNIIHRDIKPENIIVIFNEATSLWTPHLTDFDLAWFSTATQLTKDAIGTVYYAAPEQLRSPNSKTAHEKTVDVFSFGQLCYFLITGSDPQLASHHELIRNFENRLLQWPIAESAKSLSKLYATCTEEKPEKRISSFDEIVSMLLPISQALRDHNGETYLQPQTFIEELVFLLINFQKTISELNCISFSTTSGQTNITIRINPNNTTSTDIDFETHITPSEGRLLMEGLTCDDARKVLNMRVDSAIRGERNIRRKSGSHGTYEVYVEFTKESLNVAGARRCAQVMLRIISAIEK